MAAEYWVINGHHENCAYLRSLDDFNTEQEDCDCAHDDNDGDFWDEEDDLVA